jgi:hypothetical protein
MSNEEIEDAKFTDVNPQDQLMQTLSDGTEEEKKDAYEKLVGAIGNDFISTVSVLHHVHKQEKIDQMRMTFDTNEGDVYEIFIVRDREKRLSDAHNEGLDKLFKDNEVNNDEGTESP